MNDVTSLYGVMGGYAFCLLIYLLCFNNNAYMSNRRRPSIIKICVRKIYWKKKLHTYHFNVKNQSHSEMLAVFSYNRI